MKTPEISVIIPAYNAQDTIVPCLDSIMRQDGALDFEIIIVNDGSTDNTGKIIQEYRYNRPNIQLVNLLSNRGISVARNSAMQLANGRYITFVDADDMVGVSPVEIRQLVERPGAERQRITPLHVTGISYPNVDKFVPPFCTTYFTNLLKAARPDTHVVLGGKLAIDIRKNLIATFSYPDIYEFDLRPSDKSAAIRNAYMRENANFALYNRHFLETKRIRFQPKMKLDEDILFCMQAVLHAETVITAPDVLYMYVRHDNSASTPVDYWASYDLAAIQCFSVLLQELSKYPEYSNIFFEWLQEFRFLGKVAHSKQCYFPGAACGHCIPDIKKCTTCKRLSKLLNSNIKTFVKPGTHR